MATIDELLKKQKSRLEKMSTSVSASVLTPVVRKKIARTGPTRPWQENLPQYQETTPLPAQLGIEQAVKTGHKSSTNRTQIGHKSDTKPDTNRTQIEHKVSQNIPSLLKTGHKPDTQPDTNVDTNRAQTGHKPDTKQEFSSLVGLQREITIFIYESCKNARSRITERLSLEHVALSLNIRLGSVKTTLRRLEEKSILRRDEFKIGRGGWSRYELPDTIYRELLLLETEHKPRTNRTQTGHKPDTQPDTQPDTRFSSSSSFLDLETLKTTTTGEPNPAENGRDYLAPEWLAVDTSPLSEIGLTQTHLIQVVRQGKLTAAEVESSIEFFAFDLKRNDKAKTLNGSPLNFFMGILRKGIPYAPPENFESPANEARRRTREVLERKERERQVEEKRIRDLEFSEWRRKVNADELVKILPEYARKPGPIQDSALMSYFEEKVRPEKSTVRLEQMMVAPEVGEAG